MRRAILLSQFGLVLLSSAAANPISVPDDFVLKGELRLPRRAETRTSFILRDGRGQEVEVCLTASQVRCRTYKDGRPVSENASEAGRGRPRRRAFRFFLIRRGARLSFLGEGYAAARWSLPDLTDAQLKIEVGKGVKLSGVRVQPTEDFQFADDFMRGGSGRGEWNDLSGQWALDRIPYPTWSASPFRYRCDSEGAALSTAGYWFWNDYAVCGAVRPGLRSGGAGLAAGVRAPGHYLLLRWLRTGKTDEAHRLASGIVQLVRITGEEEQVLGSERGWLDPTQWYRFCLVMIGERVFALMDGRRLFDARLPDLAPGKIGLWAKDAEGVLFDDVRAEGISRLGPELERDPSGCLAKILKPRPLVIGDRFANDKYMQQWATPKGEWTSQTRDQGQEHWHIGYFGSRTELSWEVALPSTARAKPIRLCMAADGDDLETGYLIQLGDRLTLSRQGTALGQAGLPDAIESITWQRSGPRHRVVVNQSVVLEASDPDPLPGGRVGLHLPAAGGIILDPGQLTVRSPHVYDYTFSTAPVDWRVASGSWDITSRWICTPKWSWFGGVSHEAAMVWSKRQFRGDQVIDLHSAVMMDYGVGSGYRRFGDMNLSFCADGSNLGSGYTLMYGGFNNARTCLWRRDKVVAERADRPYPTRKGGAHKNWYNLRAEKLGGRVRFYLNQELILEYEDPEPLEGGHVALWTWDGGMMIPRVRIFAEKSRGPGNPLVELAPGSESAGNDEFSALRVPDRNGKTPTLTFVNPRSGGDFSSGLPPESFDGLRKGRLSFGYRIPPEVRLHLYLKAAGQDFYVALNAPEDPPEHVIRESILVSGRPINRSAVTGQERRPVCLARLPVTADDRWRSAEIDLSQPLQQFFPRARGVLVEDMRFANWCNTDYLMCGFGGNPQGASFAIARLSLENSELIDHGPCPPRVAQEHDDYETDSGLWRQAEGSAPFRMFRGGPDSGRKGRGLCIASGPLGFRAVICDRLVDFQTCPALSFSYRCGSALQLSAAAKVRGEWLSIPLAGPLISDGAWHRDGSIDLAEALSAKLKDQALVVEAIALASPERETPEDIELWLDDLRLARSPFPDDTTPSVASQLSPGPGARNASQTVEFTVTDDGSGVDASSLRLRVNDAEYTVTSDGVTYIPASGVFSLRLPRPFRDREAVRCEARASDRAGNQLAKPVAWEWEMDYSQDTQPPAAPYVVLVPSQRIALETFEDSTGEWKNRRGGTVRRTSRTAATGAHSAELRGYSTFARFTPFDASEYPRVCFDYCLEPGAQTWWLVRIDNTNWEVGFSNPPRGSRNIGQIEGVQADGQWHRAELDLMKMLQARPEPGVDFVVEHLATFNSGSQGRWFDNFSISSPYETAPTFEWAAPSDATGIAGYSICFDQSPDTVPNTSSDTKATKKTYERPRPGTHYFHVRAKDGAGNWGPASHAKVVVAKPPDKR